MGILYIMYCQTILKEIHQWLEDHQEELIQDCQELLKFPSKQEKPQPNQPFGMSLRHTLDFMLQKGQSWEMKTKDLEGYIGYSEIGQGEKMIMAFGHIDVVPEGKGWTHDPFGANIIGDYLYSRGSVDDKGPTMASYYAVRALQQIVKDLPKRVRCVFGCNEESGFACIDKYVQEEELPEYGFSPDADWPLAHAEKGVMNLIVSFPTLTGSLEILEIQGGEKDNVVPDFCEATLKISPEIQIEVKQILSRYWDKNIFIEWNNNHLNIKTNGLAAHSSTPHQGDSAITRILRLIWQIAPVNQQKEALHIFETTAFSGGGLGIAGSDEPSRDLTSNLSMISQTNNQLVLNFNIRYPVTWKGSDVTQRAEKFLKKNFPSCSVKATKDSAPLYVPLENPLVQTILEVYKEETGENLEPLSIGGGTYARVVPNTVSVGTGWAGDTGVHGPDERIKVEHILKLSKIYAAILYRLLYI